MREACKCLAPVLLVIVIALAVLSLVGCAGTDAPPTADDYMPHIAVAIGLEDVRSQEVPTPVPRPIGECENCDGTGILGDGTIELQCPECDGTGVVPSTVDCEGDICEYPNDATTEAAATVVEDELLPADSAEPSASDAPPAPVVKKIKWVNTDEIPMGLALVHFWQRDCPPCLKAKKNILGNDEVNKELLRFDALVSWDRDKHFVAQVNRVPADAIYVDRKRIAMVFGMTDAASYLAWLRRYAQPRE